MPDDDLSRLDDWFGRILHGLEPGQRKKAALKLGQELRRANLKRMERNVEPEGAPMEARKPRLDKRGRLRKNKGRTRMFKGLRDKKHWRVDADADGVNVSPVNSVIDRMASVSQFGEVAPVGRHPLTRVMIRYRYPERRLLGFAPEDEQIALDVAAKMIAPKD